MRKYFIICLFLLLTSFAFSQKTVRLGIVSDFAKNDKRTQTFNQKIISEIQKTVGSSFIIQADSGNILMSDYNEQIAESNYKALNQRCDLIVIVGTIAIKVALKTKEFSIPTIAIGVINPEMQGVPYSENGTSGRKNFSYILTSQDIYEELNEFYKLIKFKNLTFLFNEKSLRAINPEVEKEKLADLSKSYDSKINTIAIRKDDILSSLKNIPKETDAVYIVMPYEINEEEIKQISDYLIQNKIPSFSMNKWHLNYGILACNSDNNGLEQILRKTSIMVDGTLRGEKLSEMTVALNTKKELSVNLTTAQKIDYSLTFDILFTANLIQDPEPVFGKKYSIEEIIEKAIESNLDIQFTQKDIEYSEQEIKNAKSQFLPDVNFSATGVQIDKERANPLIGQAEKTLSGTGTIQQLVYSEQAIANIRIQKYLKEAQRYETQQEINNIILDCYIAYFNILQAKTNVVIQKENYEASKKNLELARIRVRLGSSTNAEIYRWKSEVANANQSLIEAKSKEILAKYQLNNILNNKLKSDFQIKDAILKDNIYKRYIEGFGADYFNTPQKLKLATEFLIEEALKNHPAEKQLEANINAIDRQQKMNKRRYYTPTIAIQAQADNVWWRGGEASKPPAGTSYNNSPWNAGISVSYPIFSGNQRRIDIQKTKIQKEQMHLQKNSLDNNLALNIKSKTIQLVTAYTNLSFSKISSENAQMNFELVQENYKQGTVSVTQLIDAQKVALQAKQAYAFSVYNFLIAHIQIEYSIGFFSMLSSNEDLIPFKERFKQKIFNQ